MKRDLLQSPAFIRAAKRFVKKRPEARAAIRETLIQLQADAFDPVLRTHKLKGEMAGCCRPAPAMTFALCSNLFSTVMMMRSSCYRSAPMMKFIERHGESVGAGTYGDERWDGLFEGFILAPAS